MTDSFDRFNYDIELEKQLKPENFESLKDEELEDEEKL